MNSFTPMIVTPPGRRCSRLWRNVGLFGWCTAFNIGILAFSAIAVVFMKDFAVKIHSSMFGIDPTNLLSTYLQYLGNYKIATLSLGAHTIKAKLPEDQEIPAEQAFITFPPERTKLYADGRLVA